MLVFVDESGDTGFKFDRGSSERFVVTLVIFSQVEDAHAAEERLAQLRHELSLQKAFEFHYAHNSMKVRDALFVAVKDLRFSYCSIAINKQKLEGPGFRFKESFYKYACRLVLQNAKTHLENAKIVIDGSGSREFRQQLGSYLRRHMNDREDEIVRIKKVQLEDSKKNSLIQLADMVCGAVAHELAGKESGKRHCRHIRQAKLRVQVWPT